MSYNNKKDMSKKWPIGNCAPEKVLPDLCSVNTITPDNKVRNLMKQIPAELYRKEKEGFDVCDEQPVWQPVLNAGPRCNGKYVKRETFNSWANLSPDTMGGYVRIVKDNKETVVPIMGKIDIPNYFMPCSYK